MMFQRFPYLHHAPLAGGGLPEPGAPVLLQASARGLAAGLLLGWSLFLVPAPCSPQVPTSFHQEWDGVRTHFRSLLKAEGVIGGALWFVHDGEVLEREFYGFADIDEGQAVDEHTIYHWASITKTLTGIAIMQLRDRKLLSLDDPIARHVPELRTIYDPEGEVERVTLRHLLSHSGGFRAPTWPWGGNEEWHPHEPREWEQLVAMMPYTRLHFPPGSGYSYSNPGIVFLGQVVERLSGDDWEVYVDKNIFKPLGMTRSYFDVTPYHLQEQRSNNYYVRDGAVRANGKDFDTGITVSNGGWNAPVGDVVRYLSFLMGTLSLPESGRVLDRSSLQEMWQPQLTIGVEEGLDQSMGLTFFLVSRGGIQLIGHTGSQKGFLSFIYLHPDSRTAAVAAFNTLGIASEGTRPRPDTRRVLASVRERLVDRIFPLFADAARR